MMEYLVVRTDEGSLQTDLDSHAINGWKLLSVKWNYVKQPGAWPEVVLIMEKSLTPSYYKE
jgi:hypothetical protein